MSQDAEFYRKKWEKCQERCELLEKENRWIVSALKESQNLRVRHKELRADLRSLMEPVESLETETRRCMHSSCDREISPFKRSDAHYCSAGCRNNANSYIAYHRKKARKAATKRL